MAHLSKEKLEMYRRFASTRAPGLDKVMLPVEDLLSLLDMADQCERMVVEVKEDPGMPEPVSLPDSWPGG